MSSQDGQTITPALFFERLKSFVEKIASKKFDDEKVAKIENMLVQVVDDPEFDCESTYNLILAKSDHAVMLGIFRTILEKCYQNKPIQDPFVYGFLNHELLARPKAKEKSAYGAEELDEDFTSSSAQNQQSSASSSQIHGRMKPQFQQNLPQSEPKDPEAFQKERIAKILERKPEISFQDPKKYTEFFEPMVSIERYAVMAQETREFTNIGVVWKMSEKKKNLFCELQIGNFPAEDIRPFDNNVHLSYKHNNTPINATGCLVSIFDGIYRVKIDYTENKKVDDFFKSVNLLTTGWHVIIEPKGAPYRRMLEAMFKLYLPTMKERIENRKEENELDSGDEEEANRFEPKGIRKNEAKGGRKNRKFNQYHQNHQKDDEGVTFRESCISDEVMNDLFRKEPIQRSNRPSIVGSIKYDVDNLPPANESQRQSIDNAFQYPISLVQGPPGTGKTITATAIVWNWVNRLEKDEKMNKVLVCAPSNYAVDRLTEKLAQTQLKVVRVFSKAREGETYPFDDLTLHKQRDHIFLERYADLIFPAEKKKNLEEIIEVFSKEKKKKLDEMIGKAFSEEKKKELEESIEHEIIEKADVVCCTCVTAGSMRFATFCFKSVLIDESTQSSEPECLIPITKGSNRVVLIGDPQQLPGLVTCREIQEQFGKSLFMRLCEAGIKPTFLDTQHRMHPHLSYFPNVNFYDGKLKDGVAAEDRMDKYSFPFPNRDKPSFFIDAMDGIEEQNESTSYSNRLEASIVAGLVEKLHGLGCPLEDIGVITPYLAQRNLIRQIITLDTVKLEIATVDSFQGKEKDYIIYCCVRSNVNHVIGFLANANRMNVAFTRCKYGLMVVGNSDTLRKSPYWKNFLFLMRGANLIISQTEAEEKGIIPKLEGSADDFFKNEEYNQDSIIDMSKVMHRNPLMYYDSNEQNGDSIEYEKDEEDELIEVVDIMDQQLDDEPFHHKAKESTEAFDEKEESKLRLELLAAMVLQEEKNIKKRYVDFEELQTKMTGFGISCDELQIDMCKRAGCFFLLMLVNKIFVEVRDISWSKNLQTEQNPEYYLAKINDYKQQKLKKKEEEMKHELQKQKKKQEEEAEKQARNELFYQQN